MTRDTLAKTHQDLKKELVKQGVQLDGRNAAFKLISGSDGETILYVALGGSHELTEQQIENLNAAGCMLDDGNPTRIAFIGSKKQYAHAIVWSRLEKQLSSKKTEGARVTLLERRIKTLESELKGARDTAANELAMTQLMEALTKSIRSGGSKARSAVKAPTAKQRASDGFEGIATIALSDWHWGEVVDKKNVNGMNEYNLAVASRRADRIFDTTLALLDPKPGKYDALMVPLLGDMLSGIIHDELVMTNEASVIDCILSLVAKLDAGLYELAQHFPALIVSCVFGNHGRIDKRKTFKNQAGLNYETLVYRMLEQQLRIRMGDACNIKFKIGTASDVFTSVYGKTFLYTHGDQFDAYTGNVFEKVRAGDMAKRKRALETRQLVHDYLVCGHYHTYAGFPRIIMNGSLVGYNEYAYAHNLSVEQPQQALFVNHPDFGITKHLPVFADDPVPLSKMIAPVSIVEVV